MRTLEGGVHHLIRALTVAIVLTSTAHLTRFPVHLSAQQPTASGAVELRPGVVIDAERRVVFVMNPKGGIDALGLNRGELVWHSDDAARPLAATGGVVVAQAEPARPDARARAAVGNELLIRVLDARTGRRRLAVAHALPAGTRANVVGTAEGTFSVRAQATSAAETTLAWEFVDAPIQGVRPGALDVDASPADARVAAAALAVKTEPAASGAVRVDLTSGKAAAVPINQATVLQSARRLDVAAGERVGSVTGDQFLSSDGRHILASERIADDSVWDKFQWTVFDRSGQRVGTLRDHRSHAPFMVIGTTMFYETGPVERRTERGMVSEPLSIRAVSLVEGAELWIRAVRDTTYRGPFPS